MKPSSLCQVLMVLITAVMETSSQCEHISQTCEVQSNSRTARGKCSRRYCYIYSCSTEYSRGYEVHTLAIYEPISGWRARETPAVVGDVMVNIVGFPNSTSLPLKLVLSSYEAARWKIYVPPGRLIEDIQLYSQYESYCTIEVWGNSRPRRVYTKDYGGFGEDSYKLQSAVKRRFGFITSLSGTRSTEAWNLTVGVNSDCTTTPTSVPDEHDVRLVDGYSSTGTVQVYVDDMWVELLETEDSINTATVVCRELLGDRVFTRVWRYNQCPTTTLWVASCNGTESMMSQCGVHPLHPNTTSVARSTTCKQSALKVGCHPFPTTTPRPIGPIDGDLRLVDGGPGYGRVEIYYYSQWGTICDDGWGIKEAAIVCRTLGFPGKAITRYYGEGTGQIWLVRVDCLPRHSTFLDCSGSKPLGNYSVYSCTHAEDVGVECTAEDASDSNGLFIGVAVALSVVVLIVIVLVVWCVVKRTRKRQSGRAVRYHPSNESDNDEADIQNICNSMRDAMPSSYVPPANTAQSEEHSPPPAQLSDPSPPDYHDQAPPSYGEAVHFSRPTESESDTADPPPYDALFRRQPNDAPSSNI